jgi:DNA-binding transcriptional ArsR family regulator
MTHGTATATERELFRRHAEVLHVLSNPVRHEIVHRLAEADRTVGELTALTGASKSNVSQHLALLRVYGLVEAERSGRSISYCLTYPQLSDACRLIDEILLDQADKASRLFSQPGGDDTPA